MSKQITEKRTIKKDQKAELLSDIEKEIYAEENQLLIRKVAHKFSNTQISHDDLFGIAQIGFVKALHTFRKDFDVRFSTYAYRLMSTEILMYLRNEKRTITTLLTENSLQRAEESDIGESLEEYRFNLPKSENEPLEFVEQNELKDELLNYVEALSENEQIILKYRYGLEDGVILTQSQIGELIGLNQSSVSKIEAFALKKLQEILKNKDLFKKSE